jgi:hypothetical protein
MKHARSASGAVIEDGHAGPGPVTSIAITAGLPLGVKDRGSRT